MDVSPALITSIRAAVAAAPDDVTLRLHLAELLLSSGDTAGAVSEVGHALHVDPSSAQARELMARAIGAPPQAAAPAGPGARTAPDAPEEPAGPTAPPVAAPPPPAADTPAPAPGPRPQDGPAVSGADTDPFARAADGPATESPGEPAEVPAPDPSADPADPDPAADTASADPASPAEPAGGFRDMSEFDWSAAEREIEDIVGPAYVVADPQDAGSGYPPPEPVAPTVTLADVGGMEAVKERLHAAFLAPMRNPELQRLYGKSLRGGLLLYGPPGCGKTFIARALAGELGADFLSVGITDVLDMYLGQSERNIGFVFAQARRRAPCVVFFDEIDAIGRRRDHQSGGGASVVHQLLLELDSVNADNEGVFVLAATNQPWEVDSALRRPGRFDRTVLVVPPDASAREAILRYHLRDRPIENIEIDTLVRRTEGFSGADLAHLCDSAAERALLDSAASGEVRLIQMPDFEAALSDIRPSTETWLETARGVAMFGNQAGAYDELVEYLNGRTAR
ncbi:ATP-binding protein [Streptomonospora nanhaiensis]|uniref:ATP-binding protein n=1 Tax=Streptomonospora nanhaiensis TaxID=1323731 RepID=UPI001C38BD8F|nr:ATP-binding protein [Streptomonospora nanhaiensis]MBV2366751.1 ATP-binding protein [Streptomonospora nanhaiensis]